MKGDEGMKLFVLNLSYTVTVDEEMPTITTLKYNKDTGDFEQIGVEGEYIKNDLICIAAERQEDLLDVIKKQIGKYGEDITIEIIDAIDLDNVIQPERTIEDEYGNTHIIPAIKGKVVFQGGFDIYKEELKDLLDAATDLLIEAEVL